MRHLVLISFGILWSCLALAQPNWNVNPHEFQFSMTVVGVVEFHCEESTDSLDKIGAFVDGVCVGVAQTDQRIANRHMAYLTVYANRASGDTVSFSLYDASSDTVRSHLYTLIFEENGVVGQSNLPYVFQADAPLEATWLTQDYVYEDALEGDLIGALWGETVMGDSLPLNIELITADSLGSDNAWVIGDEEQLLLAQDVDFNVQSTYQIYLNGQAPSGCSFQESFLIQVVNTNAAPTGIDRNDTTILENEPAGSLVMELLALDPSPNDVHTFELIGTPEEWPHHAYFEIDEEELLSTTSFDYETQRVYTVQILIRDQVGNHVLDTVNIGILDVIEFEDLKANNFISPNGDGSNDYLEIPNVYLFEAYELLIYNENGNVVYEHLGAYDNSWNGVSQDGSTLPSGSYYFVFQNPNQTTERFTGVIHLLH